MKETTARARILADRFRRHHKLAGGALGVVNTKYLDGHDAIHSTLNAPPTEDGERVALHAESFLAFGVFQTAVGPITRRTRSRIRSWARRWGPALHPLLFED